GRGGRAHGVARGRPVTCSLCGNRSGPEGPTPAASYGMQSDEGPQCTDCRLDDAYEVMTVADFEDGFAPAWFNYGEPGILIEPPQAGEGISDAGVPTGVNPPQPWWGLQVADLSSRPGGGRCGSKYALHMEGGPFAVWGGGYVTRHFITRGEYMTRCSPKEGQCLCQDPADIPDGGETDAGFIEKFGIGARPKYMPEAVTTAVEANGCMFWASPVAQQPSVLGVDLADFDGVSFWARRGPSGQSTLRVALIDDSVSADLALFQERRYWEKQVAAGIHPDDIDPDEAGARCKRVLDCCEVCNEITHWEYIPPPVGGAPDDPNSVREATAKRCWLEGERLPYFALKTMSPGSPDEHQAWAAWDFRDLACGDEPTTQDTSNDCWVSPPGPIYDSWKTDYELCCPMTMEEEQALNNPNERGGDPRYGDTECLPYVFNFDQSSGNYCYSPGQVLPEKNQNRCDESFEAAVNVATEWRHFRIPWRELRRFTPDKPPFDPDGVWQLAFYFGQGYLDTYIDDVGFYKRRPNAR
ncbi:MAG TPA: hypothetical protein VFZ53_17000, partial [Polyangiaceae bacterium]